MSEEVVDKIEKLFGLQIEGSNKLTPDVEVMGASLFNLRVCSSLSIEETLEVVRAKHPAGTSNNWGYCRDHKCHNGDPDAVTCADNPDRKHFVFAC